MENGTIKSLVRKMLTEIEDADLELPANKLVMH